MVCNFCLKNTAVAVQANAVAICSTCLLDGCFSLNRDPSWSALILMRVLQELPNKDGESLVEPIAHAAVRLFNGNLGLLQKCGEDLAARDTTAYWRGASIVYAAIIPALMTALDARRAIYAALFAGDFAHASTISPARTAEKADRCLRCHQTLVGLLRTTPQSVEAKALREQLATLGNPVNDTERMIVTLTKAFADVHCGDAARGLAAYKPFRDDPLVRPWHLLAIGDALAAIGDTAAARTAWSNLADRSAWESYWPSRARERLGVGGPYR